MNNEFERIVSQRGWERAIDRDFVAIMERIEGRLSSRLPQGVEFAMTTLQKQAIDDEKFWRNWDEEENVEHLVIQGATSAGKTLLAELNILDTLSHDKKAIILVPLKAMVHERTVQFQRDMEGLRVRGASSDYMENDERLLNDDYDVAIIVYEKFFAMLSQGAEKLMQNCGLLVVDELSMLSKDQRGPKLEMVLEIVRKKYSAVRIMCLATCDCRTEMICSWLNVPEPIFSAARPVALEEHIIQLDGKGIYRQIPAGCDPGATPELQEERVEISGYKADWRPEKKTDELLKAVIGKLYQKNANTRILIFVGARSAAVSVAQFLRENAADRFPAISASEYPEYGEFLQKVSTCDRDDGQEELIDTLLPRGIAYHHAGISTTLRELIEEEFQKPESPLKIIVATETLTIGVNMPFDAMIMLTNKVPRGGGEPEALTPQEYRNYIGRAGRLGQSNRRGVTYLFVENATDKKKYWGSYDKRDEILSALTKAPEKDLAPYYLSLLVNQTGANFDHALLQKLFDDSFLKVCNERRQVLPELLYDQLYHAYLADVKNTDKSQGKPRGKAKGKTEGGGAVAEPLEYAVTPFGSHMAPYALSIDTCIDIYWFFYEGYLHGGFPAEVTQQDIESDRYLLDLLYHVCRHVEISGTSNLNYPKDDRRPEQTVRAKSSVLAGLQRILNEEDENGERHYILWCDALDDEAKKENELWTLMHNTNIPGETDRLQAALRAIVLFYWVQGKTVKEIKDITRFGAFTKVVGGDIERLAEVVAFHLDAIQRCLSSATIGVPEGTNAFAKMYFSPEAVHAFHVLQTRVKYGMPKDLVQLANKHIHGLDRARLLKLKDRANEEGWTPLEVLFFTPDSKLNDLMTPAQHAQLCQAINARGAGSLGVDVFLQITGDDAGTAFTEENRDSLRSIAEWDGTDPVNFYKQMKAVLGNGAFRGVRIATDADIHCVTLIRDGDKEIRIGIPESENSEDKKKAQEAIEEFFQEGTRVPRLLVIPSGKSRGADWSSYNNAQISLPQGCTAVVDTYFLTKLLANAIRVDLGGGMGLFELLSDIRGVFTSYEDRLLSQVDYIRQKTDESTKPAFRLLCSSNSSKGSASVSELKRALSKTEDLCNYEILPWGSWLNTDAASFAACPTVVLLEREQITRSESLTHFMYLMRQQQFHNCLLLLDSEEAKQTWNNPDWVADPESNSWNPRNNQIPRTVASDAQEKVQAIRRFVSGWKHDGFLIGISYAHYEPQPDGHDSDVQKLKKLAKRLAEEYGEHRILFDEFPTAHGLFPVNGQERSLAGYKQCKLHLILWNSCTKENENCKREREVILRQCEAGAASCMFLQCGQPSDPPVPSPHFANSLQENMEELFQDIQNELKKMGISG